METRNIFLYWVGHDYKLISILRNLMFLASVATNPATLVAALIGYGLFKIYENKKELEKLAEQAMTKSYGEDIHQMMHDFFIQQGFAGFIRAGKK